MDKMVDQGGLRVFPFCFSGQSEMNEKGPGKTLLSNYGKLSTTPKILKHGEDIYKEVFWTTASLLNLTVDLMFVDTYD